MGNNKEEAFTNVQGKTNFKQKNDASILESLEPTTHLGFLVSDRSTDLSDHFYVKDALETERNMEELLKSREAEELANFRESSVYRPLFSSTQTSTVNFQKRDKSDAVKATTKLQIKSIKKRKLSAEPVAEKLPKVDSGESSANMKPTSTITEDKVNKAEPEKVTSSPVNALSSLLGAYDDQDSD